MSDDPSSLNYSPPSPNYSPSPDGGGGGGGGGNGEEESPTQALSSGGFWSSVLWPSDDQEGDQEGNGSILRRIGLRQDVLTTTSALGRYSSPGILQEAFVYLTDAFSGAGYFLVPSDRPDEPFIRAVRGQGGGLVVWRPRAPPSREKGRRFSVDEILYLLLLLGRSDFWDSRSKTAWTRQAAAAWATAAKLNPDDRAMECPPNAKVIGAKLDRLFERNRAYERLSGRLPMPWLCRDPEAHWAQKIRDYDEGASWKNQSPWTLVRLNDIFYPRNLQNLGYQVSRDQYGHISIRTRVDWLGVFSSAEESRRLFVLMEYDARAHRNRSYNGDLERTQELVQVLTTQFPQSTGYTAAEPAAEPAPTDAILFRFNPDHYRARGTHESEGMDFAARLELLMDVRRRALEAWRRVRKSPSPGSPARLFSFTFFLFYGDRNEWDALNRIPPP